MKIHLGGSRANQLIILRTPCSMSNTYSVLPLIQEYHSTLGRHFSRRHWGENFDDYFPRIMCHSLLYGYWKVPNPRTSIAVIPSYIPPSSTAAACEELKRCESKADISLRMTEKLLYQMTYISSLAPSILFLSSLSS